jgi:hypothetical protein
MEKSWNNHPSSSFIHFPHGNSSHLPAIAAVWMVFRGNLCAAKAAVVAGVASGAVGSAMVRMAMPEALRR